jgi:hypothetical protein
MTARSDLVARAAILLGHPPTAPPITRVSDLRRTFPEETRAYPRLGLAELQGLVAGGQRIAPKKIDRRLVRRNADRDRLIYQVLTAPGDRPTLAALGKLQEPPIGPERVRQIRDEQRKLREN